MPNDEEQIRTLIGQWAAAVHRCDMNGAVAEALRRHRHVRCAHQGVRGIDAYRDTWPVGLKNLGPAYLLGSA